jgi:hypothetical protein
VKQRPQASIYDEVVETEEAEDSEEAEPFEDVTEIDEDDETLVAQDVDEGPLSSHDDAYDEAEEDE